MNNYFCSLCPYSAAKKCNFDSKQVLRGWNCVFCLRGRNLKAHQQISKKQCFGKYCSCDKACQFYRTHPDGVICKKLTINNKYINKQLLLFINQTMSVSGIAKKKYLDEIEVHTCAKQLFNYFSKCVHETKELKYKHIICSNYSSMMKLRKIPSCWWEISTLHEKSRIFQHQYQRQAKICIYLYLCHDWFPLEFVFI